MKTIVAGIDGSEHAEAALYFAAEEASVHKAPLLVICAWEIPMLIDPMAALPGEWFEKLHEDAEGLVQAALARVKESHPKVSVEGKAIEGHPAEVLLDQAKDAGMIVLGSHGRGEFATLLLGSVVQQVIHHAPCPVVVVRVAE
ncbi:MAG: universal stress protein [Actinobacteria bacterium]|nr:universal stress protein [Actinomycetota bacterium]